MWLQIPQHSARHLNIAQSCANFEIYWKVLVYCNAIGTSLHTASRRGISPLPLWNSDDRGTGSLGRPPCLTARNQMRAIVTLTYSATSPAVGLSSCLALSENDCYCSYADYKHWIADAQVLFNFEHPMLRWGGNSYSLHMELNLTAQIALSFSLNTLAL